MPRRSYTTAFKLRVIEYADAHGNRSAARLFGVDESNVRLWRRCKPQLDKMPKSKRANRGGVRAAFYEELESKVLEWIAGCRVQGLPVSIIRIRLKAKLVSKDMNVTKFKASNNWCYRFLARHDLLQLVNLNDENNTQVYIQIDNNQQLQSLMEERVAADGQHSETPATIELATPTTTHGKVMRATQVNIKQEDLRQDDEQQLRTSGKQNKEIGTSPAKRTRRDSQRRSQVEEEP